MPTKLEILDWLESAKEDGATHVIVVCDTFSHEDYPVNVMPGIDVRESVKQRDGKDMQRVEEVYALHLDLEAQLSEHRAMHLEYPPAPDPAAQATLERARGMCGAAGAIGVTLDAVTSKRVRLAVDVTPEQAEAICDLLDPMGGH